MKQASLFLAALLGLALVACGGRALPEPERNAPPDVAIAATPTRLATRTPAATATIPATATLPPTATPQPTPTATATPTPWLDLQPTTWDGSRAGDFIAGGAFADASVFAGRVFEERATGATVLLAQSVYDELAAGLPATSPEIIALAAKGSAWGRTFDLHTNPARRDARGPRLRFPYHELVIFDRDGQVYAWSFEAASKLHNVHLLRPNGARQTFRWDASLPATRDRPLVRWDEGLGLVLTDGWRITHRYNPTSALWATLDAPVELASTPEQRLDTVAQLLNTMAGLWNRRTYLFDGYLPVGDGQMLIAYGGRNGISEAHAQRLRQWIEWALANSQEFRQVFEESEVRWLARDDAYLNRRNWGGSPDAVATHWGIIYHQENEWVQGEGNMGWNLQLLFHEISRIWNEQQRAGCGVNNEMTVEVETRLLNSVRDLLSPANLRGAEATLAIHRAQRPRPCSRLR